MIGNQQVPFDRRVGCGRVNPRKRYATILHAVLRRIDTESTVSPTIAVGGTAFRRQFASSAVPHFYRSSEEFVIAAQAAVSAATAAHSVAVLVSDIDRVEDPTVIGSLAGSTLGAVAEIVRHMLRSDDHVGWIENGLVIVLSGATADDGRAVAERICAAVRNHAFGDHPSQFTLSVGSAAAHR